MASEIRVDKITSLSGVGTITPSPTGIDIAGITTAATLRATTGIVTSLTAVSSAKVGSGITLSPDGDIFATGVTTATTFSGSGASLTDLPAANLTGTLPAISGANLTNLDASDLASGTVPTARLGSGTASSSTFLRGDSTFATVTSTTINNNANNRLITGSGTANTLEAETNIIFDGTNLDSGATTDNSVKTGTLRVNHYTHSATNPINVIGCSSGNGYNNVQIGGNDTSFSGTAATGIRFYTGGTATTANGTLRGYFDTGGNFGISNGNLVIGTSGKGIDFSATSDASGASSELLDDYEEGTYTPTFVQGMSSVAYDDQAGNYIKVGRFVNFSFFILISSGSYDTDGTHIKISLPFSVSTSNLHRGFGVPSYITLQSLNVNQDGIHFYITGTAVELYSGYTAVAGGNGSNQGGRYIIGGGSYFTS